MSSRIDFEVSERDFRHRSVCRACGADIVWQKHPRTGRAMPLDVASAKVAEHESNAEGAPLPAITYRLESHFARCPQAERFRGN